MTWGGEEREERERATAEGGGVGGADVGVESSSAEEEAEEAAEEEAEEEAAPSPPNLFAAFAFAGTTAALARRRGAA